MSLIGMLLDLFTREEERSHFEDDPTGYNDTTSDGDSTVDIGL